MLSQRKNNVKRILLTGGGTGGSVAPLLAIADSFAPTPRPSPVAAGERGYDFLFVGTRKGLERGMVERAGIKFKAIAAGKFRRYFSLKNLIDPLLILAGFFQAFFIILKWRPDLIMSAGSFVSVPVVWAGWLLRVPILIHQQDVRAGLANKLMAPFARVITVTFKESLKDYGKKAVWTGNVSRNLERVTHNARAPLIKGVGGFENNLPVVLVIGGGTGASALNHLALESLKMLNKFCNIILITGKNKNPNYKLQITNYKNFEFLNSSQMAEVYAAADIVVSRAGMGVLTELSALDKPAILIPMPDSHQEDNARIFSEKGAAVVLNQKELTANKLADNIKKLLENEKLKNKLSSNIKKVIKEGNKKIVEVIKKIVR